MEVKVPKRLLNVPLEKSHEALQRIAKRKGVKMSIKDAASLPPKVIIRMPESGRLYVLIESPKTIDIYDAFAYFMGGYPIVFGKALWKDKVSDIEVEVVAAGVKWERELGWAERWMLSRMAAERGMSLDEFVRQCSEGGEPREGSN